MAERGAQLRPFPKLAALRWLCIVFASTNAILLERSCEAPYPVDFVCSPGWVKSSADRCGCLPTCEVYNCTQGWKKKKSLNETSNLTNCCAPTCSIWRCSEHYVENKSAADELGQDDKTCCKPLCSIYKCSDHYVRNPHAANEIGADDKTCCLPTCQLYNCGLMYTKIKTVNKIGKWTDCCKRKCRLHFCTGDYVTNDSAADEPGQDDKTCCKPLCSGYKCSWDNYLPNPLVANKIGADDLTCCLPSCNHFEWCKSDTKTKIKNAKSTIGSSEKTCCEDCDTTTKVGTCYIRGTCDWWKWAAKCGGDGVCRCSKGSCAVNTDEQWRIGLPFIGIPDKRNCEQKRP